MSEKDLLCLISDEDLPIIGEKDWEERYWQKIRFLDELRVADEIKEAEEIKSLMEVGTSQILEI
jgi:hypothetical protein